MKKFEQLGRVLPKNQLIKVMGGTELEKIGDGEACNCNSSDDCAGNAEKKTCYNGAAYSCTPGDKIGWCEK